MSDFNAFGGTAFNSFRDSHFDARRRFPPCPSAVSFELSVVPVAGAQALWTLSATNTSTDLAPDAVCSWQVTCAIDFVTVFNNEATSTDLAPVEISGTITDIAATITYLVFLTVHNSNGDFCGLDVQTFDAASFSLPDTITAAGYPCTRLPDVGQQQFWIGDGGAPVAVHMDHTLHTGIGNFDGVGREADAALLSTAYRNKVPADTSPYGVYTAVGGGTLTVA